MSRIVTYLFFLIPTLLFAQQKEDKTNTRQTWERIREENGYKPSDTYKGPQGDPYFNPSTIKENQPVSGSKSGTNQPYQGVPYNPSQQKQGKTPSNPNGPGGSGSIDEDPNIEPAEPVDVPEYDSGPSSSTSSGGWDASTEFWKWLGIILAILAVAYIIYHIIKNRTPREKHVTFNPIIAEMNPAEIQKSELELRLEEAQRNGDYKECVRIYFLFAMKDLIERRWIFWKREKTNMHYIIEMQGRASARSFEKIVSIYDLVWYGDYNIDAKAFKEFEPALIAAYHQIEQDK